MDLTDPDLINRMVESQAKYEFRLAVIEWFVISCAVILMVTVLLLLFEDYFQE